MLAPTRHSYALPELYVFARPFVVGFILSETIRLGFHVGARAVPTMESFCWIWIALAVIVAAVVGGEYIRIRNGHGEAMRVLRSGRIDLLVAFLLGVWSNEVLSPQLTKLHALTRSIDPNWPYIILAALTLLLASPVVRYHWSRRTRVQAQRYFLEDTEVHLPQDDLLRVKALADTFAANVIASGASSSVVFGLEGPWGTGKTTFINLAEQYWTENASASVIVFRFEPLRYSAEPDLSTKFIRDLSATMRKSAFAPEFPLAASRYSRMLKGTPDITFLGFKISLVPTNETVDEVLESIDAVLLRIRKRLIVVIDDLDRLDPKAINNVLFAVRRTYNLSQATYVLCYDADILTETGEEAHRTRHFLEKFITVKMSLFVDRRSLSDFLRKDWKSDPRAIQSMASDTMLKLSAICSDMADALTGDHSARYLPLLGDLRKVKRFVNAALLMRIDQLNVVQTDFIPRDLIHLMLLHLHYPGIFRRIIAEETDGRSGMFSVERRGDRDNKQWANSDQFEEFVAKSGDDSVQFLLRQLFDAKTLGLNDAWSSVDRELMQGRACFNSGAASNLDKYLQLIVRFAVPEPRHTFRLYQDVTEEVLRGASTIEAVLKRDDFGPAGERDDAARRFWRVLLGKAHAMNQLVADQAFDALIDMLPACSSLTSDLLSPRKEAVFSLARLLDVAGWGRSLKRPNNSPENLVEISDRIFGLGRFHKLSLIDRLSDQARGALGWDDLLVFRMTCSPDRGGQLFNLSTALVKHEDSNAKTEGLVSEIARIGMRALSQAVFRKFRAVYLEKSLNFYDEVDRIPDSAFSGQEMPLQDEEKIHLLLSARQRIKSYVVYQLANSQRANGSGVGCGYYDEAGTGDRAGIAQAMNSYLFGVCFDIQADKKNAYHFADFCLRNFQNAYFSDQDGDGFVATESGLVGGFDKSALKRFWIDHGDQFKALNLIEEERRVVTGSYIATYRDDLPKAIDVLDQLAAAP